VIGLILPSGTASGLVPDLGFMADDPGEIRDRLAEHAGRPIGRCCMTTCRCCTPRARSSRRSSCFTSIGIRWPWSMPTGGSSG